MSLFITILSFIQELPQDSIIVSQEVLNEIIKNADQGNTFDTIFKVIITTVLGGGGLFAVVKYAAKKYIDRKEKKANALEERKNKEQIHSNQLETEMFKFDKEKYMNLQESNQSFQNTIINEIFDKFVKQSQWITNLHDKSIENLVKQMTDVNKVTKDVYVQNDVLTNRIRNLEDRFIKNSNIIVKQLDIIMKLLIEKETIDKKSNKKSAEIK